MLQYQGLSRRRLNKTENYKFFQNEKCEFFPCHKDIPKESFSCLFCYCPLYFTSCGGNGKILESGIKDCSDCKIPHIRDNYDYIMKKISCLLEKEECRGKI